MIINKLELKKYNKDMMLTWEITHNCNYRCEYCFQGLNKKSDNSQKNAEEQAVLIKKIILDNKKKIKFLFFGGEPSIFDLTKIVNILDNEFISKYSIITNLSRDKNYYLDLYNEINNRNKKLNITASLHETQCDYKEFLNKVKYLIDKNINIAITFVVNDKNINILDDINNFCFVNKIKIRFNLERDANNEVCNCCNETIKKFELINDNKIRRIFYINNTKQEYIGDNNCLNLKGYKCYLKNQTINPDGIIKYSCSFIETNYNSIYDNNIKLYNHDKYFIVKRARKIPSL